MLIILKSEFLLFSEKKEKRKGNGSSNRNTTISTKSLTGNNTINFNKKFINLKSFDGNNSSNESNNLNFKFSS